MFSKFPWKKYTIVQGLFKMQPVISMPILPKNNTFCELELVVLIFLSYFFDICCFFWSYGFNSFHQLQFTFCKQYIRTGSISFVILKCTLIFSEEDFGKKLVSDDKKKKRRGNLKICFLMTTLLRAKNRKCPSKFSKFKKPLSIKGRDQILNLSSWRLRFLSLKAEIFCFNPWHLFWNNSHLTFSSGSKTQSLRPLPNPIFYIFGNLIVLF